MLTMNHIIVYISTQCKCIYKDLRHKDKEPQYLIRLMARLKYSLVCFILIPFYLYIVFTAISNRGLSFTIRRNIYTFHALHHTGGGMIALSKKKKLFLYITSTPAAASLLHASASHVHY